MNKQIMIIISTLATIILNIFTEMIALQNLKYRSVILKILNYSF